MKNIKMNLIYGMVNNMDDFWEDFTIGHDITDRLEEDLFKEEK